MIQRKTHLLKQSGVYDLNGYGELDNRSVCGMHFFNYLEHQGNYTSLKRQTSCEACKRTRYFRKLPPRQK